MLRYLRPNRKGALCAPFLLLLFFSQFTQAGMYPSRQDAESACHAAFLASGLRTDVGSKCTNHGAGGSTTGYVHACYNSGNNFPVGDAYCHGAYPEYFRGDYDINGCPEGSVPDPDNNNLCNTPTPCSEQTGTVLGATPIYRTPAGQCANSGGSLCQVKCSGICVTLGDGTTNNMSLTGNDCDVGQESGDLEEVDPSTGGCPPDYIYGQVNGESVCLRDGRDPDSNTSEAIETKDTDGDGETNDKDPDIDGDGIPNSLDDDMDGDGVPNGSDNDVDGDGVANHSDTDIDGDGIPNNMDNDADGDGIPNSEDTDSNGSGTVNGQDVTQLIDESAPSESQQSDENAAGIDEAGQAGLDEYTNALNTELTDLDANGVGDPSSNLDWFGILPTAACTDFSFSIPGKSSQFSVTCADTQLLRDLMGFLLVCYALFTMYELFTRRPA